MALTLGTNSYSTVATADAYFDDNLQFASWDALDSNVKSRALVTASGQISQIVKDEYNLPIATGDITEPLENATAELALYLQLNQSAITAGNTGSNQKRVKAGSVEVESFRPVKGQRFSAHVMNILKAGGLIASSGYGGASSFGLCGNSTFSDANRYDRDAYQ